MIRRRPKLACAILAATLLTGLPVPSAYSQLTTVPPTQFADGDRVVMIGDGLIEQEQYFGWIETMLTTADPLDHVTFRNLGWNGDTPAGDSRFGLSLLQAGHEPADEGWKQLQKQIDLTKPTVAIIGYGMANALDYAAEAKNPTSTRTLQQATADFEAQLDRLAKRLRESNADCQLIFLTPISPVGESAVTREMIDRFADVVFNVADKYDSKSVNLLDTASNADERKDAVHLNNQGYKTAASTIAQSLGFDHQDWKEGRPVESLRKVILEKNRLWFHRSRPANMAYVFGFRKHEQGQNAVEIPQFDPLIEAEEAKIAKLRALKVADSNESNPQIESQYAEFTPQPHPEFVVGDGLEVSLWAENPMLNKPIHMNFDPQGRLWVVSSEAYPMIEVGQSLPDKVLVLEDSNNDGKADKSTVFADQLLIPTGIAPSGNGVYVAQSTDLLFLEDTDGDGKADRRDRVLSGFGTEDTHHNLHTLNFGPDGRLYMNQSVYTRTDAETPHGVARLKAGGGFRFDPSHRRMDIFFHGLWNPWGHQFDQHGNSFMTDGAGFQGIAYVFPGATFNPTPGARQVLDLISPGNYPKFCGGEIVQGDSIPDDWQGSFVTCDFRANRVTRFTLSESESGFVTTQQSDLLRTNASTFRPIDIKQGPDGALYVADWSNPIINHGEVDFRDPRRDRWHGRIWRIAVKDQPTRQPTNLREQSDSVLVTNLFGNDRYLRDQSRRVLIERGEQTLQQLASIWSQTKTPRDHIDVALLSAALGKPNPKWLETSLQSEDSDARTSATRILGDWADYANPAASIDAAKAIAWLEKLVVDSDPRVRLEAICALNKIGTLDAIKLSLQSLQQPSDRFIAHALFNNVDQYADALIADLNNPSGNQSLGQKQLEFLLTSVPADKASRFLSDYLANNGIPKDGKGPWIELIAKAGGENEVASLYQQAMAGDFSNPALVRALTAVANARKFRKIMPKIDSPGRGLRSLLKNDDPAVRTSAIELIGAWRLGFLVPQLVEIAEDDSEADSVRLKAIDSLRSGGNKNAADALVNLAGDSNSGSIRNASIAALAVMDANRAIKPFYSTLAGIEDETAAIGLWRSMLSAKDGEKLLVSSMPTDGISQVAARAGIRAANEIGKSTGPLIDALMPQSGLTMTAAAWSPERAREIRQQVELKGDPHRGELVYRRQSLQCTTCHAIGGVGGKVGPDMTSLGAGAPIDYIIESLFDPNAKIKENFHSVTVLNDSGQVFAGIEQGSTDDEMVLRDATGKTVRLPRDEIVQVKQGKSLMPAALLDRIPQQDQLDLIKFLTRLGKPGDFDASRQTVARVLEVFAGTHRIEQQGNGDIIAGKAIEGWKPLQSRVSGKIERETLQQLTAQPRHISLVNIYLRTKIEVSSDTVAKFSIDNFDEANVWIDGKEQGTTKDLIKLPAGQHTLLLQIDARDLPESIAIRSEEVTFVHE
ncbi:HEAT repeat domain-containing protein [Stieleria sp. JC731]|uniref:PVC-type heme-binding CxxCH protein n=1 Tax=Pirellulaceae TaxID=2691357 RepID=UPI001E345B8C|nr:PVC-type heme-binding CxxCH protein [Stieleria sp. JC731]MCC9599315.1 HEAT repeat domain-containing protein [Stieleria sp. JC731]